MLTFPLGKEAIYLRQAVRQVLTFPLGKEAVYLRQAVRQAAHLPLGEGSSVSLAGSLFPGRCSSSLWGSKQFISGRQSGRHSPSSWGRKQFSGISGRQSGFPGGRQANNSPFPLRKEAVQQLPQPPSQALTFPCWGKFFPSRSVRQSRY